MSSVAWPAEGGEEKGEMGATGGLYIICLAVCMCVLRVCAFKIKNLYRPISFRFLMALLPAAVYHQCVWFL